VLTFLFLYFYVHKHVRICQLSNCALMDYYIHSKSSNLTFNKLKYALCRPFELIKVIRTLKDEEYRDECYRQENQQMIDKMLKEEKYDYIFSFCEPYWRTEGVSESDFIDNNKWCIYQLDPHGLHELEYQDKTKTRKEELRQFDRCEYIFTTPVLYEQYKNDKEYSRNINKMLGIEFPNIAEKVLEDKKCIIDFDKSYCNIAFCGIIDDRYRSPEKFLSSISEIIDKGEKIRVYFVGSKNSRVLKKYSELYPDSIFSIDKVELSDALLIQKNADILLNIGNTLSNMVPSKIFDYFSMGKPIINIQKIAECPAKRYFDKYPLCATVKDFNDENYSGDLLNFIRKCKNCKVPFENIRELYKQNTPEFIADSIIKFIEKGKEI